MADKRVFRIGAALFLFLPIIDTLGSLYFHLPFIAALDFHLFATIHVYDVVEMLRDTRLLQLAVYVSPVGLILLVMHHSASAGTEEKAYRLLDRLLAAFLVICALFSFGIIFYSFFWHPDAPSPYVGILRWLVLCIPVISTAVLAVWAYGLWSARHRMVLLFSVCAVATFSFLPYIPANNPDYDVQIDTFYGQLDIEHADTQNRPASSMSDAEASRLDTDNIPAVQTIVITRTGTFDYFLVLLLVYTWLRRTEFACHKENDESRASEAAAI